jgi:cell division protein FtsA
MDSRRGYPNEHLGKSRIDAVKSPMYATTVGLVLNGFGSADEKNSNAVDLKPYENRINEAKSAVQKGGSDFFKKIIDRTKGLLIDDFDDKQSY